MPSFDSLFAQRLGELAAEDRLRVLRPVRRVQPTRVERSGRPLIDFSSNDYLGLSRHPLLVERARRWAADDGAGAGASRLVTGSLDRHHAVETKIAAFKGAEAALLFNSGWQANASILPALFDPSLTGLAPLVFTDRLNHSSLHHGCAAAGVRQIRFRHNDLDHLEALLIKQASIGGPRFIVTESVFSMDGDRADVQTLAALARRYDAFLYLDEAHATGVLGPGGRGLSATVPGGVDLVMGTFSKAFGGFGAYVAGSRRLIDYLVNTASGLIYATALPPAVLGAIDAALDLMPDLDERRERLSANAARLRMGLAAVGLDTGLSTTQIVPVLLGAASAALAAAEALEEAGYLGVAIRPPTVPRGQARIRLALCSDHRDADLDGVVGTLADWRRRSER